MNQAARAIFESVDRTKILVVITVDRTIYTPKDYYRELGSGHYENRFELLKDMARFEKTIFITPSGVDVTKEQIRKLSREIMAAYFSAEDFENFVESTLKKINPKRGRKKRET